MNTLCALAAESPRDGRARGLAEQLLRAMRTIAERHGLTHLVAPVRPSLKERYPLTPIGHYVGGAARTGSSSIPWMRVHERLGARVCDPLPESLRITGTVAEWESWTGMAFPESGDYVFPEGLAPVYIDRAADRGSYWEPNVWMVHPEDSRLRDGPSRDRRAESRRRVVLDPDRGRPAGRGPGFPAHLPKAVPAVEGRRPVVAVGVLEGHPLPVGCPVSATRRCTANPIPAAWCPGSTYSFQIVGGVGAGRGSPSPRRGRPTPRRG